MHRISPIRKIFNALLVRTGSIWHAMRDYINKCANKGKPKLLIFTDSRGYEVTKAWNRKSAYSSYVGHLAKDFDVDYVICPEFSTTIVDFLYEYQQRCEQGKSYDAVIAHVGVVDFSPRPVTMLNDMMAAKGHKLASLFDSEFDLTAYHQDAFLTLYDGKPVKNFYPTSYLIEHVIPALKRIDNLVMIGCSPVVEHWRGNYWRDRPHNMNMILDYSAMMQKEIFNFVDISMWDEQQVKTFTVDNIHLNAAGFEVVYEALCCELSELGLMKK